MTDERLFTARFWLMCGVSFTAFLAAFQLYPTAPFRILALGGTETAAGMFLGLMTYASALSALFTGALADQVGKRRMLVVCSAAAAACSLAYAFIASVPIMLMVVVVHGIFWSGLMTAAGGYLGDIIPAHRRAEGMGYYGVATVMALAVAPALGLWIYNYGWQPVCLSAAALNLLMVVIAYRLPETGTPRTGPVTISLRGAIEWRVLMLSGTLFLYYFGYGGVASFAALYATANQVTPPGIYFSVFAASAMATTLFAGPLGDRFGHARLLVPALVLITVAYALLGVSGTKWWLVVSAVIFGFAFRAAYQLFTAYVLHLVEPDRRGAAFGGIIAALDTGVGTGSITMGWIIGHYGFGRAFATAACMAAASIPYFLVTSGLLRRPHSA
jgi:MFS family permease